MISVHPPKYKGNNKKYSKFIIFAHPRSGSGFLVESLNKNKQILLFAEILNIKDIYLNDEYHEFLHKNNIYQNLIDIRKSNPRLILNWFMNAPLNERIKTVGFKIFPEQINSSYYSCSKKLNNYLMKEIDNVILLKRKNLLKTYVSLIQARKKDFWHSYDDSYKSDISFKVNLNEMINYFKYREYIEMFYQKNIFDKHNVKEVIYEDMIDEYTKTMNEIQEFLNVDQVDIDYESNKIKKMEFRQIDNIILNYDEVSSFLMKTKWKCFV